jgi:hypothetical protein
VWMWPASRQKALPCKEAISDIAAPKSINHGKTGERNVYVE